LVGCLDDDMCAIQCDVTIDFVALGVYIFESFNYSL
jgi:hypothetical protein